MALSDGELAALELTRPDAVARYRSARDEMEACKRLLETLWTCADEKKAMVGAVFVAERVVGVVVRWVRARGEVC